MLHPVVLQADETLAKFLDFCTYGHMIDNVVLIVTGTLHERDVQVGMLHCHMLLPGQSLPCCAHASNLSRCLQ